MFTLIFFSIRYFFGFKEGGGASRRRASGCDGFMYRSTLRTETRSGQKRRQLQPETRSAGQTRGQMARNKVKCSTLQSSPKGRFN